MYRALIVCFAFIGIASCQMEDSTQALDDSIFMELENELAKVPDIVQSSPEKALAKCDHIITQAQSVQSHYYSGKAKWYKGYIYDEITQDVSQAYFHYQEALKDLLKTDSSALQMSVYTNLGVLYRFYGQYDAAIDNYEAALELSKDLSTRQLSDLYYNYGVALKLKGDDVSFQEAERAFTESIALAQKIDYSENIASVNNQIGLMYKVVEDYDMSRIAYQNTIRDYLGDPTMSEYIGKAYHGIGVTHMEQGNTEEAATAFKRALKYKRMTSSIFVTKYDLGTVLFRSGNIDAAIDMWKGALNEKHDKNNVEQVQIYAELTTALARNQQFEEALGYSEIFNQSIQNILANGKKYKIENDRVLFEDIVREYDEFNATAEWSPGPLTLLSLGLALMIALYILGTTYYKLRLSRRTAAKITKIQTEFQQIKVD